ncbi:FliM/FliN family flagellar motor switch protein [Vibrio sp. Vb2880]|uniref:Flagellar motor switch protein FliN n=2 Tax=Vibrio furnissii TaxID=29494 RepID=A0A0Q2RNL1_VIBFU|nr:MULTISPECIES: FliM/FliN family flagellar motor switch protein [Vibrio]ADT87405.1 hypothetical flagellar motor switch protein [Vibrio furnissii NCTC 11218]EEX42003.1 flagellar motor switch protein FliN [Vibrio furnissii CIP 102972]KQH85574.1 flagellar motor switch protein FliN [Vibrio furnissii]MBO0214095.1 FliM/FliN family flagellar motor switch protein [Vibrio sp. Vb2880]MCG6211313.1 FliM/FliN family flagellar motor switch protein [Vibrio furnissii]
MRDDLDAFDEPMDDLDLLGDDLDFDGPAMADELSSLPQDTALPTGNKSNMGLIRDIPVEVTVEVSRRRLPLKEIMSIEPASVIMLDKQEGEPVDIKINGVLFGTGNIIIQDGKYGVQVLALVNNEHHE